MDYQQIRTVLVCLGVIRISLDIVWLIGLLSIAVSVITFEVWHTPIIIGAMAASYLLDSYAARLIIDSGFVKEYERFAKENANDHD